MDQPHEIDNVLRVQRIILLTMAAGLVTLSVIAAMVSQPTDPPPAGMLLIALGGLAVVEVIAYGVLRSIVVTNLRARVEAFGENEDLFRHVLPATTILKLVGGAMAEGLGMFGAVIYLMTRSTPALAAPAVSALVLLSLIPTRSGLIDFASRISGRRLV